MTITSQQIDAWDDAVDAAYEAGRQEGMKQERALWTLTKLGQEIEAQPEQEPKIYALLYPQSDYVATPDERPWVGLKKEEIDSALSKYQNWYDFAAHLENILKEKNQ